MKWLKKLVLRCALNHYQRAWIWNAVLCTHNRHLRRGSQNWILLNEISYLFFGASGPIFNGNGRGSTQIDPTFIVKGSGLPADVKQVIGEDGEPDVEIDDMCRSDCGNCVGPHQGCEDYPKRIKEGTAK